MGWFNDVAEWVDTAATDAVDWVDQAAVDSGEWMVGAADAIDHSFDKDGWMTEFVQDNVPLGGFVTAIVHSAAGHNDYAELAAVKGLSTTVEFAVSTAATFVAGPIAGGAISGFVGPFIKGGIAEFGRTYLVDDHLKAELPAWDFEDVAISAVVGAGIGAAAGAAGDYLKGVAHQGGWIDDVAEKAIYTNAAGDVIEEGSDSALISYVKTPLLEDITWNRVKIEGADLLLNKAVTTPIKQLRDPLEDATQSAVDAIAGDDETVAAVAGGTVAAGDGLDVPDDGLDTPLAQEAADLVAETPVDDEVGTDFGADGAEGELPDELITQADGVDDILDGEQAADLLAPVVIDEFESEALFSGFGDDIATSEETGGDATTADAGAAEVSGFDEAPDDEAEASAEMAPLPAPEPEPDQLTVSLQTTETVVEAADSVWEDL